MTFNKFLGKLVIFLLPLLLIALLLESNLRKIPNDYSFKKEQLLSKSDSIELLILGGSHTAYDINPEYLDTYAFNLAYVSQTMYLDNLVFKEFYKDLPKLNTIVLMMAYPTLSHIANEGEESWRKFNYFRYYGIEPESKIHDYYLELFNIPFKQNIERLYNHLIDKPNITCDSNGWFFNYTQERSANLDKTAAMAASRHENGSMDFTRNVNYLDEILSLCKQDSINVYILSMPLYGKYIENLNQEKFLKMKETSKDLAAKYSNVEYLDFSGDERFTVEDFYDADHLNDHGAEKFSKIVNEIIVE